MPKLGLQKVKADRNDAVRIASQKQNPRTNHSSHRAASMQPMGNQAMQRMLLKGVQAKLKVSLPGDQYEQEADRVADMVMRMSDSEVSCYPLDNTHLQRNYNSSSINPTSCPICYKEKRLYRKIVSPAVTSLAEGIPHESNGVQRIKPEIESQINGLQVGGQPLSQSVRSFFEPRFGHDLSQVRVHADAEAAEAARAMNAQAFTVGQNIVFGAEQYSPLSVNGRRLLAHELTHVLQQKLGIVSKQGNLPTKIPQTWRDRVDRAERLYNSYRNNRGYRSDAESAYVDIIADMLKIDASGVNDKIHTAKMRGDYETNKINFDIDLELAGTVRDPGDRYGGDVCNQQFVDYEAKQSEGAIVIGSKAFNNETDMFTKQVIEHEKSHILQKKKAKGLQQKWLESRGAMGNVNFPDWLQEQTRIKNKQKRISETDKDIAIEVFKKCGTLREVQAHLEGFISDTSGYHLFPINVSRDILFHELNFMIDALPPLWLEINDILIRSINLYYCSKMDDAHQKAFDNHVLTKLNDISQKYPDQATVTKKTLEGLVAISKKRCK